MHPDLAAERTDALRNAIEDAPASSEPGGPPPAPRPGLTRIARRLASRTLGRYVDRLARARSDEAVAPLDRRLSDLEEQASDLRSLSVNFELLKAETVGANAVGVNLELIKEEFRNLLARVEELGMAIAPGAGLDAAPIRIAELRERVNALDRRLRHVSDGGGPEGSAVQLTGDATPAATRPADGVPQSALFDYVGFERRFRGDPDTVLADQRARYGALLAGRSPVVDIGCGRGELLSAVAEDGTATIGVDTDAAMVAEARARGLDVREEDAVAFLAGQAERSLGAIVSLHVVEHLELDQLIRLLELAASRLQPGGIFVAETPNPASLIVLGNSYILDPTHVRPLHPSLLTFLCEGAGFRDVRLEFYAPATGYHLPTVDAPDGPAWLAQVNQAFAQLNEVLFGPQEYAVIATTPG